MLWITAFLFCLLTIHLGINISRAFDAFIHPPTSYVPIPGSFAVPVPSVVGSAISYDTYSSPKYIANEGIWLLTSVFNDGFLVRD